LKELFTRFGENSLTRMQAVFTSIFVIQNRLQTAHEKTRDDLTMKQWLLLTMVAVCPEPHTLTNVAAYMGCSRQNIKQLAAVLSEKGYVRLILGENNSVNIELTEKLAEYEQKMGEKHTEFMRLLFSEFSEDEILSLYRLYAKLYTGLERIEARL